MNFRKRSIFKQSPSFDSLQKRYIRHNEEYARVLVIFTGGTIGMVRNKDGVLEPKQNVLEKHLRNDPLLNDPEYIKKHFPSEPKLLALPDTRNKRRVVYYLFEYDPLLDSSNMAMEEWSKIAKDIKDCYKCYEGFVILHGTDTMSYTASALSFMLENLEKSVIVTGSQIPIFEIRSDGRDNLISALIMAGNYIIPEVTLLFNNKLFRGNRTQKQSSGEIDAFDSPNMEPLAKIGVKIHVDKRAIFRQTALEEFRVQTELNENVTHLRIFPHMSSSTIKAAFKSPIQGVVVESFGAGNVPTKNNELIKEVKAAKGRGVITINTTQCTIGGVDANYATGKELYDAGALPGMDMTPEAALVKLSYVLAKKEWNMEEKRKMMQKNIRGELTEVKQKEQGQIKVLKTIADTLSQSSAPEKDELKEALLPSLLFNAVLTGDVTAVELLLLDGADISSEDYDGRTVLHMAISTGKLDMVKFLLEKGSSMCARDNWGKTPLLYAIENGHAELVKLLTGCGAHLVTHGTSLGRNLCQAVCFEQTQILKCYFLAGADCNTQDEMKRTPLHVAVEKEDIEMVAFLLGKGAETDIEDKFGRTALDVANQLNKQQVLSLLNR